MSFIEFLKLCLIGLIQGITEPLPISSSAHMIILGNYLNLSNDLNFEIIINFSSTLAIIIFFRKKIFHFIKNVISNNPKKYSDFNRTFFIKLIVASIPTMIVGFLLKDIIDKYFMNIPFVSIALIITSIINFCTYLFLSRKKIFTDEISYFDALTMGLMQSIALLPGISRSGSTVFGGTSRNVSIEKAFDFSFFLYLIASLGAFMLSLFDLDFKTLNISTILVPFIICFISTFFSIKWFYGKLNKKTLLLFSIYTFLVGTFFLLTCAIA